MAEIYDSIGGSYTAGRRGDPKIAARIHLALAGAESIVNIGAGTGSYEPKHDRIVAVEPSEAMIKQRDPWAAPVVKAHAERLPFKDKSFSHCLAVLSMHHWMDRYQAFKEITRVTRDRLVVITWDPDAEPFWLTRDYFPEMHEVDQRIFPPLGEFTQFFGVVKCSVLAIPANCRDGFLGAYWRRPNAYLDPRVRANMSTFAKIANVEQGIARLRDELGSGEWQARNREILAHNALDIGYRIVTVELSGVDDA